MGVPVKAFLFGQNLEMPLQTIRDCFSRYSIPYTGIMNRTDDIAESLAAGIWPIICVLHDNVTQDGMGALESLIRRNGFELFPYFFLVNGTPQKYVNSAKLAGARGYLKLPLVSGEVGKLLREVVPASDDTSIPLAISVSQSLMQHEYAQAVSGLMRLAKISTFSWMASIAVARCEAAVGNFVRAEEMLSALLGRKPGDVRVMCELIDVLRQQHRYAEALAYHRQIMQVSPHLTLRVWEYVSSAIEQDELDEAASVLDILVRDASTAEHAVQYLARFMIIMGQNDLIPFILKPYKHLVKQFAQFEERRALQQNRVAT